MQEIYNSINIPVELKRIFIRFTQAVFSEHYKFKWDYDVSKSDLIIVDKHSFDIGVAVQRPSIVLSRGDLAWTFTVRGQDGTNSSGFRKGLTSLVDSGKTADKTLNKKYSDLLRGSIVFNVLAKNGIVAESIANDLFVALTGHKEEFMSLGFHQFIAMNLGSEQIIRSNNADVEVYGVAITLGFLYHQHLIKNEKIYNVRIILGEEELFEGSNLDYTIITNGTQIKFIKALPVNIDAKIFYTDAITENQIEAILVSTADPLIYLIPNGGSILGYYKVPVTTDAEIALDYLTNTSGYG